MVSLISALIWLHLASISDFLPSPATIVLFSLSILTFLQEWFPEQKEKVIKSLNKIGASKSSEIIKKTIELLPENGTCFFESSNEESERIMNELDSEFSNYPDGTMRNLYRKYGEKNRNEL